MTTLWLTVGAACRFGLDRRCGGRRSGACWGVVAVGVVKTGVRAVVETLGAARGKSARCGTSQPKELSGTGTVVHPGVSAATAVPGPSKATPAANARSGVRRLSRLDGVTGGSGRRPELLHGEPTLAPVWRTEAKS
jgi:hypothetical protein